jgi:hypothetical protein
MAGHSKELDLLGCDNRRKGSDYGGVFPACFDEQLRNRVAKAIHATRSDQNNPLDYGEIREIVAYITELEDVILRHHWGRRTTVFTQGQDRIRYIGKDQ